jgi:hypothetical protein
MFHVSTLGVGLLAALALLTVVAGSDPIAALNGIHMGGAGDSSVDVRANPPYVPQRCRQFADSADQAVCGVALEAPALLPRFYEALAATRMHQPDPYGADGNRLARALAVVEELRAE